MDPRTRQPEQGQILPIMAILVVILVGLLGLALDLGRVYIVRAQLSRALDAAALAGVLDLPSVPTAQARATQYMAENMPNATISFPPPDQDSQFRVRGSVSVDMLFMKLFGFGSVNIEAEAAAGFGLIPVDTALMIDATGSMGASPCNGNQNNSGCPIKEARDAASLFVQTLLGGTNYQTQVGFAPFRGCYNPPRLHHRCVPGSNILNLSSNASYLQSNIANVRAVGGTGTNVCLALRQGRDILYGPGAQSGSNVAKFLVILSDGDNTYNSASYGQGAPPAECRPNTSPQNSDTYVDSNCRPAQTRERELDVKTKALADSLKAQGVEIYVVAFGVCGNPDNAKPSQPGYCNGIGNGDHDNAADRRLLKCIASSTDGTNDHYFEVATASDLPDIFGDIARAIAFRLIE